MRTIKTILFLLVIIPLMVAGGMMEVEDEQNF